MIGRLAVASLCLFAVCASAQEPPNPLIDYDAFAKQVAEVGKLRKQRRLSEADFIRMAKRPGAVVLDARSDRMFHILHVKGAKNLSLPDMTADELAQILPDKDTLVLIYCNNNFKNAQRAFPTKVVPASLNVHTFNVLYSYGYRNIYELGPLIDIRTSKLEFEGDRASMLALTSGASMN
jgi:phage shock protein E